MHFRGSPIWSLEQFMLLHKIQQIKRSHQRCSIKKGGLRNFTKFTGKHLCQSLVGIVLDMKLSFIDQPATLFKKRLWHRYFLVNFQKFLRTPFLQNTSGRLLLSSAYSFFIVFLFLLFFSLLSLFLLAKNYFNTTILTFSRRRPLSYRNHWTSFYMVTTSVLKGLSKVINNQIKQNFFIIPSFRFWVQGKIEYSETSEIFIFFFSNYIVTFQFLDTLVILIFSLS